MTIKRNGVCLLLCLLTGFISLTASSAQTPPAPTVNFLAKPYRLASFNKKSHAMWEFAAPGETVNNWTTLLTLVDRPDAHTRQEMDRVAEGVMSTYKAGSGRVLLAKTVVDASGMPFNYLVAAFDEPAQHRFELNFVKVGLSPTNAYVVVYSVRVADPEDYQNKAKAFLDQRSSEIGKALEKTNLPQFSTLPRKEF